MVSPVTVLVGDDAPAILAPLEIALQDEGDAVLTVLPHAPASPSSSST